MPRAAKKTEAVLKIISLTPAQVERFGDHRRKWIAQGLSTEPCDFDAAAEAALKCYDLIGKPRPKVILRMGSPYGVVMGGPIALALMDGLKGIDEQQVRQQVEQQVGQQVRQQVGQQVEQQVWQQVGQQVEQQVEQQVWQQVRQQVGQQVEQQVWQQVRQQVGQQVEQQVWQQVRQQVWQQVGQQVRQQVRQQVEQQVGQQVEQQVWQQVRQQVEQQVWQQVRQQVGQQVEQQVWQQVRQQVWQQVGQQVRQQVRQQVEQQVGQQVEQQVWQQVEQQVRQQVEQQVGQQVGQQVWQQVGQQVRDAYYSNTSAYGLWSGWLAWISYYRDVCGWQDPTIEKFALAETLALNSQWQWWHGDVLALSDRPRLLKRNGAGRLHSDEGPAMEYSDGWKIFAWHGYALPDTHAHLIEARDKITPAMIEAEPNAELRRIALEIFGFDKFFDARGGNVLDEDEVFGRPRRLVELKLKGETIRVMDVWNGSLEPDGTRRRFMLGAPAGVTTVHQAVAASYGLNPAAYREAVRT